VAEEPTRTEPPPAAPELPEPCQAPQPQTCAAVAQPDAAFERRSSEEAAALTPSEEQAAVGQLASQLLTEGLEDVCASVGERLNDRGAELPPEDILAAVLEAEKTCREELAAVEKGVPAPVAGSGLSVELLVDEPTVRYCMCSSLNSPTVISILYVTYPDVCLEDAVKALVHKEELDRWNSQGEFKVVQEPREDDALREHVVHYVLKAPWPFWDRDVLQRRWRLRLSGEDGEGPGCAVVMRSVSGEGTGLLPEPAGTVRAFIYGAAFLLRPMQRGGDPNAAGACEGTRLTYLTQIDIGGLCPAWAQGLLMRIASRGVVEWSQKLSEHCQSIRSRQSR